MPEKFTLSCLLFSQLTEYHTTYLAFSAADSISDYERMHKYSIYSKYSVTKYIVKGTAISTVDTQYNSMARNVAQKCIYCVSVTNGIHCERNEYG